VRTSPPTPRRGDLPRSLASIAKAERLLGYEPQFRLHDGLAQTIEWYAENVAPLPAGEAAKVAHA
jgi:nucleoside-diphosphate-sugar epimerase